MGAEPLVRTGDTLAKGGVTCVVKFLARGQVYGYREHPGGGRDLFRIPVDD